MNSGLTAQEGIALDIVFGSLGESRFNIELDDWGTYYKYIYVASQAPKLTAMHADVNRALKEIGKREKAPFDICYFKAGHASHWYEKFPSELSLETVRKAWVKSGMRDLQLAHKKAEREKR